MNTKHPLYKEKLRVEREIWKLEEIQRNKNWIELDKPYKSGYYMVFDLRDDIKNRDDAWVFYECIKLIGEKVWWKDRSFKRKVKKGKYEYVAPGFGYIEEGKYEALLPAVKKYFHPLAIGDKNYNYFRKRYTCVAPPFYFVKKIKARWITHYLEFDSVIEKEIQEKRDSLWSNKLYEVQIWSGTSVPKDYRKGYNRSDRRHSKVTAKKNAACGGDYDTYDYRYRHRHSARWDYW